MSFFFERKSTNRVVTQRNTETQKQKQKQKHYLIAESNEHTTAFLVDFTIQHRIYDWIDILHIMHLLNRFLNISQKR